MYCSKVCYFFVKIFIWLYGLYLHSSRSDFLFLLNYEDIGNKEPLYGLYCMWIPYVYYWQTHWEFREQENDRHFESDQAHWLFSVAIKKARYVFRWGNQSTYGFFGCCWLAGWLSVNVTKNGKAVVDSNNCIKMH